DLDPYGAYSEKSFDYRYYRQEHKDMFIEGIVSSATAPVHGFDLSQAKDYQKKIKKCDNNLISDERMRNADLDFYIQHSPMTEGMANGMYGGNFWSWFFDKAGLLPEGYEAIPYSGEHADLYKNGELLGNSIPVIYGFSEFVVAYLQKTSDKVPYVEGAGNSWYKADGSYNYPPNNGAIPGTEIKVDLQPGQSLGRYGNIGPKSNYVTSPGASPDSLSLPPNTSPSIYTELQVVKPIPGVTQSTVAPWGGSTGLGLQYELPMPIQELIKQGYIIIK
ncbi:MAG: TNT domain-containing protein, partial [Sedimentibacter saalensis]